MSYPFAYTCMFAISFLPSGLSCSVRSRTVLIEQSGKVTVPGTSAYGCVHLWVQQQTQSLSLAPLGRQRGLGPLKGELWMPTLVRMFCV